MASQNINVGTAANDGTGEPLRDAFIDIRKMFAEVYNQTYTSDTQDLGGTTLAIKENQLSVTNSPTDGYVLTYDNASGGFTWEQVTHDKLEGRYTSIPADITTTAGTINLDASSHTAFNLTGNLGTVTLNIQSIKTGQAIDILLSGSDLSSAVITLADDFTTSAINRVGSNELDTAATNIIQVLCVDDNDSDAILTYAIAAYAADTTP